MSAGVTPATAQAARALGCSPSARTTVSRAGLFRNDRRRVPKWYSSAPKPSGRTDTCGCSCQAPSRLNGGAAAPAAGSVDTAHAVNRDLLDQHVLGRDLNLGGLLGRNLFHLVSRHDVLAHAVPSRCPV